MIPATDRGHPAIAQCATGLLAAFNAHGVITSADVHVATAVAAAVGEERERALLLVALAVRAVRAGSVCLDLAALPTGPGDGRTREWDVPAELWPTGDWCELTAASPLVTTTPAPVRIDGERMYLSRYWEEETRVLARLLQRIPRHVAPAHGRLRASLDAYFPGSDAADQRAVAQVCALSRLGIITGGPGSGKTTTVARLLGVLLDQDPHLRIALAAPTGKAAARMVEALADSTRHGDFPPEHAPRIRDLPATTIHRLLGYSPHRGYRHDENNPLAHDVVIIDEASMVSLSLMDKLLAGLAPATSLILVGDAHQLASVEVGAVFADLVDGLREAPVSPVAQLRRTWRYGEEIHGLAEAVKAGDTRDVIARLSPGSDDAPVATLDIDRLAAALLPAAQRIHEAAAEGNVREALSLLEGQQLLCAHRHGPDGASTWNRRISAHLAASLGQRLGEWYPGQPLLITKNDYALNVFNGDSGVIIRAGGRLVAALGEGDDVREVPLSQLSDVVPAYAITVHRAQGSQFEDVYVLLPAADSRILTRELFYTALTRARRRVRIVGEAPAVETAITRHVRRASGLAVRLREALSSPPRGTDR